MDWFKGKSTGNHRFSHEIWSFPVNFPWNPSIESNMAEISSTNGHLNGNIFDYQRLLGMETGDIYETISRGSNASQPPSRRGGKTKPNPSMPLSNRRVAKVGSMFITWILCVGLPSNTPMTHAGYLLNGFQWLISAQLEKHIMGTFGRVAVADPGITWIIALSVCLEERNCSETNHGRSYKHPFKENPASTCPKNTTATILYFKISETHPISCSQSTNPHTSAGSSDTGKDRYPKETSSTSWWHRTSWSHAMPCPPSSV